MIYRPNYVPQLQRFYQKKDGIRLWMKSPRSKTLLTPYAIMMGLGVTGSLWGMGRMVVGEKTFF
ncbi:hypothetical protein RUND412_010368 [Rhizina undulata]